MEQPQRAAAPVREGALPRNVQKSHGSDLGREVTARRNHESTPT